MKIVEIVKINEIVIPKLVTIKFPTCVLAEREKQKGNESYRAGDINEAIRCYSRSIEMDPENPILYANRAMGYLKIESLEKAEEDCSMALGFDCTYVKAWSRRGLTRFKRGKYSQVRILISAPKLLSLSFLSFHLHSFSYLFQPSLLHFSTSLLSFFLPFLFLPFSALSSSLFYIFIIFLSTFPFPLLFNHFFVLPFLLSSTLFLYLLLLPPFFPLSSFIHFFIHFFIFIFIFFHFSPSLFCSLHLTSHEPLNWIPQIRSSKCYFRDQRISIQK